MKRSRLFQNHLVAAAFAGVCLCPLAAPAADTTPAAPAIAPTAPAAGPQLLATNRFSPMTRPMLLDDKQREMVRAEAQKHSEELRKLNEQIREAQKEHAKAVLAAAYDEKLVREKAEAVGKLQVDQMMLQASILSKLGATLKPEQRDQLERLPLTMILGPLAGARTPAERIGGMPPTRLLPAPAPATPPPATQPK